ncbi:MAG: DNA polymerase III subunit delta [Bacteroidales bacterium]|nr:DNA polymerase III subunit delta [Bacteroidales bacterium]
MQFKDIPGHDEVKQRLINTVSDNRISHAQLFLGNEGCGKLALAIAYAQYINCTGRKPGDTDSCGTCPHCVKYQKLVHPDLHFVYPVVSGKGTTKPVSDDFLTDWRKFVLQRNYHRLDDWYDFIDSDNSQGAIFAQESQEIIRKLGLKTFEAEYKVMIIWMAEKLNETAANKLLKMIEEPPAKTLFILVAENEEMILTTIRSRVQLVKIDRPTNQDIVASLQQEFPDADPQTLQNSAMLADGNYLEACAALRQFKSGTVETPYFELFTTLMREAFSAKYDAIIKLSDNLAKLGREKQKKFFDYCNRMLRECFMLSSVSESLVNLTPGELDFARKFSPFIHSGNVGMLSEQFGEACRNIERNAYGKLVFTDLALKISPLLKIKRI